jgi:hypothetical protein
MVLLLAPVTMWLSGIVSHQDNRDLRIFPTTSAGEETRGIRGRAARKIPGVIHTNCE